MDIYDEGNFVVAAREMNFVGSGVTVTYTGNRAIVTINGGSGGGAVDSVNGQTGVVVLDAGDVGADETGSAATALTSANSYTDSEIAALTKSSVGLGNVDNTSDANKPVSTDQQAALDAKEPTISAGTTAQYWRGDKSWQTLDKSAAGLSNVDNTSDLNKPISTATQAALDALTTTLIELIRTGAGLPTSSTRYATEGLAGLSASLVVTICPNALFTTFRVLLTSAQPASGSLTINRNFYNVAGTLVATQTLVIPAGSAAGVYTYSGATVDRTAVDGSYGVTIVNAATSTSGTLNSIESTYLI
jgi:hypothetical protein